MKIGLRLSFSLFFYEFLVLKQQGIHITVSNKTLGRVGK